MGNHDREPKYETLDYSVKQSLPTEGIDTRMDHSTADTFIICCRTSRRRNRQSISSKTFKQLVLMYASATIVRLARLIVDSFSAKNAGPVFHPNN